jgi:mRNA interferase MazF
VVSTAFPQQGDIYWAEELDKRRPVLVVTRNVAIPHLAQVLVAPITRTIRNIPTEIRLGERNGLRVDCVALIDGLVPISRAFLTDRVGRLGVEEVGEICRALAAMADCP